ncbi:peptidylprolyl isomerase [Streptacidiphilus sp. ASG 303]|uniref:peptidylprolyl isomerase n=1 Tax=Streptacidiphilus sp. ASG 303 TaxID=2896847 RepID=UPI001E3E4C56|nr:peptidylprolyl isomerase [Streptacidiphilus sp. ASG 303]MCD0484194.1 peptidylprolyl isomerase [Streptacidiphilus sp. ASG 303]
MKRGHRLLPTALATSAILVLASAGAAPAAGPGAGAPAAGPGAGGRAAPGPAGCAYTPAVPADNFKGIPVFDPVGAAAPYDATLRTAQGRITFRALTGEAPCTTFSFRFLAEHRYFDRTHCHRLTTQRIYVLQCGDPTGTGSGGPGYSFPDENLTGATYPAGTVAMANAGPDTNGSQFFLVWKDTRLSPAYTPFGRVTSGLDVLQKIAAGGEDDQNGPGDGFPTLPVTVRRVQIQKR